MNRTLQIALAGVVALLLATGCRRYRTREFVAAPDRAELELCAPISSATFPGNPIPCRRDPPAVVAPANRHRRAHPAPASPPAS